MAAARPRVAALEGAARACDKHLSAQHTRRRGRSRHRRCRRRRARFQRGKISDARISAKSRLAHHRRCVRIAANFALMNANARRSMAAAGASARRLLVGARLHASNRRRRGRRRRRHRLLSTSTPSARGPRDVKRRSARSLSLQSVGRSAGRPAEHQTNETVELCAREQRRRLASDIDDAAANSS